MTSIKKEIALILLFFSAIKKEPFSRFQISTKLDLIPILIRLQKNDFVNLEP